MSETNPKTTHPGGDENQSLVNRVTKRFGGRHLIFRTQTQSGWRILPRSYALVSDFAGPVWFFYGLGQIWVTHKIFKRYDGWIARVPRVGSSKLTALLTNLESALTEFTNHCNENGIEGTVVLEPSLIEFHWTFGYSLEKEKMKPEQSDTLELEFRKLVDAFVASQKIK